MRKENKPSWANYGIRGESLYPYRWKGVRALWSPMLGPTGSLLHDLGGIRRNGTLTNMTAASDWPHDKDGYSLAFRAATSTNLVSVPDSSRIQNIWDNGGTFCYEIFPISDGGNSQGRVIDKSNGGSDGWLAATQGDSGSTSEVNFVYFYSTNAGSWITNDNALTLNVWQTVVIRFNSTTAATPTITVNGSAARGITTSQTPSGTRDSDAGVALTIGNRAAANRIHDGNLNNLILYDRKITEREIQDYSEDPGGLLRRRKRFKGISVVATGNILHKFASMQGGIGKNLHSEGLTGGMRN